MNNPNPAREPATFDLKGSMLTVMVLRLKSTELEIFACQLRDKVRQAPGMFHETPLVLDLQEVERKRPALDVKLLLQELQRQGFSPIGLRGGNARHRKEAVEMGLKLLPANPRKDTKAEPKAETPAAAVAVPAQIVTQPVRSGQQLVARDGDLVVLSTVSDGAEVLAAGSIHIYGALRGRALAGVNGNEHARIFCRSLDAALVAVAGQYQISEDYPPELLGQPAQVFLQEGRLVIQAF